MVVVGQPAVNNPFEIQGQEKSNQVVESDAALPVDEFSNSPDRADNPFEVLPPVVVDKPTNSQPEGPLIVRRDSNPDVLDARGRTLGIHIILLVFMALCWIFFRPLLSKIYQASLNEGIFNQLYRERKSGRLGLYIPNYLLFFGTAAFFFYLFGQALEWYPSDRPWQYWQYFLLIIGGFYLTKHLVLYLIGELFPIKEVISKYSFLIMLFGIMIGMILIPANLLVSYAPATATVVVVYLIIGLLSLIYLLRAGRALLLTNKLFPNGLLHFLLYICAVEIAPLLVLYRALVG